MLTALCIDLDGTLANSSNLLAAGFAAFCQQQSLPLSAADYHQYAHLPFTTAISQLSLRFGLKMPLSELQHAYRTALRHGFLACPPMAGSLQLLQFCRRARISQAVVTSCDRELALNWLTGHQLRHYFQTVIAAEDTQLHKPQPEPYLMACRVLATTPAAAVAIEDSAAGQLAAQRAGLRVIKFGADITTLAAAITILAEL